VSQSNSIDDIITYLLTHSMQHSPSLQANRFSASQEIPRILCDVSRLLTVSLYVLLRCDVSRLLTVSLYVLLRCDVSRLLTVSLYVLLRCDVSRLLTVSVYVLLRCDVSRLLTMSLFVAGSAATLGTAGTKRAEQKHICLPKCSDCFIPNTNGIIFFEVDDRG